MKKFYITLFAFSFLFLTSCDTGDDNNTEEMLEEEEVVEEEEIIEEQVNLLSDFPVQDFMWSTMNLYYFFQAISPNLADNKRTSELDQNYIDFLAETPDPAAFYFDVLLADQDRFSFLSEDYKELVESFEGVSKSNGLQFGLGRIGDSDDLFGFVEYIIPNSDASTKNIARGDFFLGVNGIDLTIDNYIGLLFGDDDTYILNMATVENNTIGPNGLEVTLTKQEGLVENPIFANKIFEEGGNKIGYLMFNQFTGDAGEALNTVFGNFKSEGVTDLILDLRYNPGGFGITSQILGSLIYTTDTNTLFYKRRYNSKLEEIFDPESLNTNFTNTTGTLFGMNDTPLTSLNLSKIYIIATRSSASASELVMNGLEPYIDVIHIGETTTGKNEGSLTFVDDPENGNVYDEEREAFINPDNQWGIQPIISRVENSDGFGDYADGLTPDIELSEDLTNLGILGDRNEPLLARAIEAITGSTARRDFKVKYPIEVIDGSNLRSGLGQKIILDSRVAAEQFKKLMDFDQ